jgi:hypothetical protein
MIPSHTLVPGSQGTQTLKQSLKDLQEMLKITQNKLAKSGAATSSAKHPQTYMQQ